MYNILMDAVDSGDPLEPLVRFPCLEIQGTEAAIYAPRPAVFKTHPPFHKNPYPTEANGTLGARPEATSTHLNLWGSTSPPPLAAAVWLARAVDVLRGFAERGRETLRERARERVRERVRLRARVSLEADRLLPLRRLGAWRRP
ncbi:hypothetical protein HPB51_017855 [Rhipicephalus microplus]|uniref:Uncharacterized protein n=1 Tax=Rhipicephalus microplus TaxID=6941 RepID=A0A9J6E3E3_RHIMP|nr:hypothetical protein HPB51_017855 [Rhipicephalus microplus]